MCYHSWNRQNINTFLIITGLKNKKFTQLLKFDNENDYFQIMPIEHIISNNKLPWNISKDYLTLEFISKPDKYSFKQKKPDYYYCKARTSLFKFLLKNYNKLNITDISIWIATFLDQYFMFNSDYNAIVPREQMDDKRYYIIIGQIKNKIYEKLTEVPTKCHFIYQDLVTYFTHLPEKVNTSKIFHIHNFQYTPKFDQPT